MKLARLTRCCLLWGAGGGVLACSVFPDEVRLPSSVGGAAGGAAEGGDAAAQGGAAGSGGSDAPGGASVNGGASTTGGAEPSGGAEPTGGAEPSGGTPAIGGQAGEGGGGAPAACDTPLTQQVGAAIDSWIDSSDTGANHGTAAELRVAGGVLEKRALLAFEWPALTIAPGSLRVRLVLRVLENQDPAQRARVLAAHLLGVAFNETRANWTNYDLGIQRRWTTPGGDFGAAFATHTLPAGATTGVTSIDVTDLVAPIAASGATIGLILRESGAAPTPPPVDLVAASSEGAIGDAPRLLVEYCAP